MDAEPRGRLTRRALLGVGGAAVVLGACGDDDEPGERARTDVEILNSALDVEHHAVAAYTALVPLMAGEAAVTGGRFLAHERAHVAGLERAIRARGGTPNRPRDDYRRPAATGTRTAVRAALALEETTIGTYLDALPRLADRRLRATAASILTVQAEHVSVLRTALGMDPLGEPFAAGRRG